MEINNITWNKNLEDRRKFPRHYPDKKNQPEVNFLLTDSNKISVNIINISKGGLMGYTSSIEHFLGIEDQNIELIEIIFPDKEPFQCPGKILRLQPVINENKCYCAVEFYNGNLDNTENSEKSSTNYVKDDLKRYIVTDQALLQRVRDLDNYCKIKDYNKETETRRLAYNTFDDITKHLTIEERWYFYEILDEMKIAEPDYPEDLKNAFLKLCRTGLNIKQSHNSKAKLEEQQAAY